jgi:hypothetical protein
MTDRPTNHYVIPADALFDFAAKIKKLNKRAVKLGCEPVTFTVVEETTVKRSRTFKTEDGEYTKHYRVPAKVVEVLGSAPKVEGYEFLARVERLAGGEHSLFHTVPGTETKVDERFASLGPSVCEHCNKVRTRKDTYVVRELATGRQVQVGRQCLADFTGTNTPEKIAGRAAMLGLYEDLREFGEREFGRRQAETVDTDYALRLTSSYIAAAGWVPKSACLGTSTASSVQNHFWDDARRSEGEKEMLRFHRERAQLDAHRERAARTIRWIKDELAAKPNPSDYERNLVTLVANDVCERKHLGIVCSAVAAYQRSHDQKIEYAKRQQDLAASRPVGAVGERLKKIPVKVHQVRSLEAGEWGPRTMVKFLTDGGDLLTWFASGDRDYIVGAAAVLTGTVKRHGAYGGVAETQLSRVVVEEARP